MELSLPPRLIRTLSEHHWQDAMMEMVKNKNLYQKAGATYDTEGNIEWEYYLTRNNTATREAEHHAKCEKYGIHHITYCALPEVF